MLRQGTDSIDKMRARVAFENVAFHARVKNFSDEVFLLVPCKNKQFRRRQKAPDLTRGLEAIQLGHGHVQYHDIGSKRFSLLNGLASRLCDTADFPVRLPLEQQTHPFASDLVIISNKNANSFHFVVRCKHSSKSGALFMSLAFALA